MWHLLYLVAFAALTSLAITNLVRNLLMLGTSARQQPRNYGGGGQSPQTPASPLSQQGTDTMPHPEMLDSEGNVIREPLLVMRSISVSDARDRLDALYEGKPLPQPEDEDDGDQD